MSLAPGVRLGAFEVVALIGSGGMGEVYRARDTRLGRDVAIKVLPAAFSSDTDRLHRFEQEARAAASLNHPNILSVLDVGTHEGSPFIVSELLEGETLRDRLQSGPLPVRKALDLGIQIAQALGAAHERGIVHRDLKPENIFINRVGRAKVLDFGLAKLTQPAAAGASTSQMPTAPGDTQPGMLLGTAAYMAPEQVRGLSVDHRADIFAFGAVLYEMLAGQCAFRGETDADTMSAILKEDPADLRAAERSISPALSRTVERCLAKDPAARFNSAGDLAFALDALSTDSGIGSSSAIAVPQFEKRARGRRTWAVAVAGVAALGMMLPFALGRLRPLPSSVEPIRFVVHPLEGGMLAPAGGNAIISPDGRFLAFIGGDVSSQGIWLRPLASLTPTLLPGTEDTRFMFWSPDSRFIGFASDSKVKKIDVTGGPAQVLCNLPGTSAVGGGGSWNRDDIILFSSAASTLFQVSAAGGEPAPVTTFTLTRNETSHTSPFFLPDGRRFLFFTLPSKTVYLGSLGSSEITPLFRSDSRASYAEPGYLLFVRDGVLSASRFDAERGLRVGEESFPVAERVFLNEVTGAAAFAASENGTLAYRTGTYNPPVEPAVIDRSGKRVGAIGTAGDYRDFDMSIDGSQLLIHRHDDPAGGLWLADVTRGTMSRFTVDSSHNVGAHWSPDGHRVAFASNRDGGTMNLYQKLVSGAGPEELLLKSPQAKSVSDWSADGRVVVFDAEYPTTGSDIWVLPLSGGRKPVVFLETPFAEAQGRLSPDGRWMAYVSNESGRNEVYVQPFPATGGKWQVSTTGGVQPQWRRDGREMYYLAQTDAAGDALSMMSAEVRPEASFQFGVPRPLFSSRFGRLVSLSLGRALGSNTNTATQSYAVSADGQRFIVLTPVGAVVPDPITVVLNWTSGLKK